MNAARVVVVGGGYAGVTVARELDDIAEVTLVEPKDHFVHASGTLRSTVDPHWDDSVFHSLENLLSRGRIIQDAARLITPHSVKFTATHGVEADYIVIATGTTYPFPAKFIEERAWIAKSRLARLREALDQCTSVLIVGAGPVGLELAGELLHAYERLRITIVENEATILPGNEYEQGLRDELQRQLEQAGVTFILSDRLGYLPPVDVGMLGDFTVETEKQHPIHANMWFRAYGNKQESDFLNPQLNAARKWDGRICVEPTMQVQGFDTVFAVGDVNNVPETKRAYTAMTQAKVAARNIRALIEGNPAEATYEPQRGKIVIPLGPNGGASQLEQEDGTYRIVGAQETAQFKGNDLMTGPIVKLLRNA
ncbi:NAD(P)/FAD-dependent oxidoreductase [Timonella sp. A28]|uniref:NAD(P)/FAD-dependent oxidoreductase n=1 Tax=Timonella sp. A28 TaxID=3442640 RepID=UPI003EBFEC30